MKTKPAPLLVAIVGGSGSGKTWLADRLGEILGKTSGRLSLDDFYRDCSHLPPARRARVNFDNPRAIDWPRVLEVLRACRAGRVTRAPSYDFKTHSRRAKERVLCPKPIMIMDGLWLLHRPAVRRFFDFTIFIDCPAKTRLKRRMARDLLLRGRSLESVKRQCRETVEPMNAQYVVPQAGLAHMILKSPVGKSVPRHLAGQWIASLRIGHRR